ncbi:MAG: hypothetical protein CM15mP74_25100 [Halieaceae bacterium]|nr:MAG: hypothetical protein CM15mP74_25100 [Halieaceae bacterium]
MSSVSRSCASGSNGVSLLHIDQPNLSVKPIFKTIVFRQCAIQINGEAAGRCRSRSAPCCPHDAADQQHSMAGRRAFSQALSRRWMRSRACSGEIISVSPVRRWVISSLPSANDRSPMVTRTGIPSNSISANFTPGRSARSSKKAESPARSQHGRALLLRPGRARICPSPTGRLQHRKASSRLAK